jgi:peptidyl-prolyl cis-trans isomerase D
MIGSMRNKLIKVVVWILAILLIASFALWGVEDVFRMRTPTPVVATVGSTDITREELNRQFRRVVDAMRARFGASFDTRQAVQFGMLDETLERLINSRLVSLEAERLGLSAGEAHIAQTIRETPEFRGPGNVFDVQRYQTFLGREGMGEQAFVRILRDDIMRDQVTGTVVAGAAAPRKLVELVYGYRNERRTAEIAVVPFGDPAAVEDPDAATLAAFHRDNAGLFTAPEYRAATVLYLDPAEHAKDLQVPEDRLKDEYELRLPSLSVAERRELRQMLFSDEASAEKAAEALRQGRPFEDTAREIAGTPPTELGNMRRGDLPRNVADAAFDVPEGAVAGPVRSALGWHLIRVDSIAPGRQPAFEEVRERIREDLAREMAIDSLIRLTAEIDDTLAGGASLEETADKIGLSLRRLEAIDARGRDRDGEPVAGIPDDPAFMEEMFSASPGLAGTLLETGDGGFFLIRVDAVIEPVLRPLDEVREQAVEAWKEARLSEIAGEKADALAEAARRMGGLAAAAGAEGYEVVSAEPFTRFVRDPSSRVPDSLVRPLFRINPGEIAVAAGERSYVVGELKEVIPASFEETDAEAEQLREQLDGAIADDMLNQYLAALRIRFPVTVNRAAVDAVAGGAAF